VTIIEVGVAWAPNPDTGGVSSIVAQWGGILSVRSDLGGGTCTTGNGKVPGNGGLKCGENSSAPRSSMITSSGSEALTSGGSMFTSWSDRSIGKFPDGSSRCLCGGGGELFLTSSSGGRP
jgi:hypothetical protein